jgi:hypothetical protein
MTGRDVALVLGVQLLDQFAPGARQLNEKTTIRLWLAQTGQSAIAQSFH